MKRLFVLATALALPGLAYADSLAVNATAAMNGTSFGLEVTHNNTSAAYVQDNTPVDETLYRYSFLFDPNTMNAGATANFRQAIFNGTGNNPNPGVGSCSAGAFANSTRVFAFFTGGIGQIANVQAWGYNNQCGPRGTARIPTPGATKVCVEWTTGTPGLIRLATVVPSASCPATTDGVWIQNPGPLNNANTDITLVRLGIPVTNSFGAGESGTFYLDEFQSFRTLNP